MASPSAHERIGGGVGSSKTFSADKRYTANVRAVTEWVTRGVRIADWPTVGMVRAGPFNSTAPRFGCSIGGGGGSVDDDDNERDTPPMYIYRARTSAAGWEINNRDGRRSLDVGGGGGGGIGGRRCYVYREHGYIILLYIGCRARGRRIYVFYMCLPHAVTPDGHHPGHSAAADDDAAWAIRDRHSRAQRFNYIIIYSTCCRMAANAAAAAV